MGFSIIVAASINDVIGINNELPWHLPGDFKHFKNKTIGKTVVMGRKTYESIGKPLPNRTNIILTRDEDYRVPGCIVMNDVNRVIKTLYSKEEVMIIGGQQVYELFLPVVDRIYITRVMVEIEGDACFIIPNKFKLVFEEKQIDSSFEKGDPIKYSFQEWVCQQ